DEARKLGAPNATIVTTDLGRPGAGEQFFKQVADSGHTIDYLVNNAGFGTHGRFDHLPIDREVEQINLNVTSLVALARLCLPAMIERGRGTIINVASTAAFQPTPFMATYGATKAFVLNFSEALAE